MTDPQCPTCSVTIPGQPCFGCGHTTAPQPHEHAVWWESATSPDPSGRFTVTEHCKCGAILATYTDTVL